MSYKNTILRLLHRTVFSSPSTVMPITPQRILAVSTTALGDTLWTMPALAALRNDFPEAYLALLTSDIGLEITRYNPWTDATYLLDRPWHLWHHLRKQFDTVILFHASQRIVPALCASLGAKRLIGTKGLHKGLDDLFTHTLPLTAQHEVDRRLALVKHLGGSAKKSPLSFFLKPEEKKTLDGVWVALHPGAKDLYKCWPIEHFAAVGRALEQTFSCNLLITGGKEEKPLMENLKKLLPSATLLDHTLSLREFAATLDAVGLLISNDTGPLHLASAVQTPAIGIYSPTDPALCGPYESKTTIVCSKPPTCRPCLRRKCREPFCLLQISPEEVFQQACRLLNVS